MRAILRRHDELELLDHYLHEPEHRALPGAQVFDELSHVGLVAHRARVGDAAALRDHGEIGAGARIGGAIVARAGVTCLVAGLAELLVVEDADRKIVGLLRGHGGQRADGHHQVGVAGDDKHALGRLCECQAQAHRHGAAHGTPQRHVERPVAGGGDIPVRRAEARDDKQVVVRTGEDLLHQRAALERSGAHLTFSRTS